MCLSSVITENCIAFDIFTDSNDIQYCRHFKLFSCLSSYRSNRKRRETKPHRLQQCSIQRYTACSHYKSVIVCRMRTDKSLHRKWTTCNRWITASEGKAVSATSYPTNSRMSRVMTTSKPVAHCRAKLAPPRTCTRRCPTTRQRIRSRHRRPHRRRPYP